MKKIISLILYITAFCFFSCSGQVPYQGVVTKYILPIKKMAEYDSILISYHSSFDGKISVYAENELIFETAVEDSSNKDLAIGGTIKRANSTIIKIVLDDAFYIEEVPNFFHPYMRILYDKEKTHLTISYMDIPPIDE